MRWSRTYIYLRSLVCVLFGRSFIDTEKMAESRCVQCTEEWHNLPDNHTTPDKIHDIVPQEVQDLYNDAQELAMKNKTKDEYIEELHLKIHQLKMELETYMATGSSALPDCSLENSSDRSRARGERVGDSEDVTRRASSGSIGSIDKNVNRDLIQSLLLDQIRFKSENDQLRKMYARVIQERQRQTNHARLCLQQQERINELEEYQHRLCNNLRIAQERIVNLQSKLGIVERGGQTNTRHTSESINQTLGLPELPSCDSLRLQSLFREHNDVIAPESGIKTSHPEDPKQDSIHHFREEAEKRVKEEKGVKADPGNNNSITLRVPTSPPLKRGRFTMEKKFPFECSNCSGFFASEEDADKTTCSYHPKMAVSMNLRNNNWSNSISHGTFWPCCHKTGKHAVKCVRGGRHKLSFSGENT